GARHAGTGGSFAVSAVSATSPAGSAVTSKSTPLPENYALEVHPLETVGSLRNRMAAVNGFGSLSEFTRLTCGKTLSGDTQTMLEVGVTDGTGIWTILSAASAQGVVRASQMERHPMGETERHYGDVIAEQSVLFDELFRLLECARGLKDHAITQAVWDLLMSLPTECELVRRVRETAIVTAAANAADAPEVTVDSEGPSPKEEDGDEEGDKNDAERSTVPPTSKEFHGGDSGPGDGRSDVISAAGAWATLLPVERNWHKTVYTLQIIDALLLPALQVLGVKPWSPDTDAFRSDFLRGGGFARVLNFVMTAPDDGDRHTV
ncbi:unnamed protein product, partial [Ascophyllum nodosum]